MAANRRPRTPDDCFEQARHNEAFLDLLLGQVVEKNPEFADWALVVGFYSALHYTKGAILRDSGEMIERHVGFTDHMGEFHPGHNDLVRKHLGTDVSAIYREMFDRGHEGRYRSYFKKPNDAKLEVMRHRILLDEIKGACGQ